MDCMNHCVEHAVKTVSVERSSCLGGCLLGISPGDLPLLDDTRALHGYSKVLCLLERNWNAANMKHSTRRVVQSCDGGALQSLLAPCPHGHCGFPSLLFPASLGLFQHFLGRAHRDSLSSAAAKPLRGRQSTDLISDDQFRRWSTNSHTFSRQECSAFSSASRVSSL